MKKSILYHIIIIYSLFYVDLNAQTNNNISTSRENAITKTVEVMSSAVVGINVTEVREYSNPFMVDDPFFRQFFGNPRYRQEVKGLGSGVIISEDGYIVTNDHVAGNAKEITVSLSNGEKYKAKLIGSDKLSDVALLKISGTKLPFANLGNSENVIIGEWVIAFGNPFGLFENIDKPIVTVGVVSAKGMNFSIEDRNYRGMIQTDAVINSGNSGGPLVNGVGEVIGINTLIYTGGVSNAYIGYGFAIPVNKVKRIIDELKSTGKVIHSYWTGLEINNVDARIARYFGLTKSEGVIISDVEQNSPGSKSELQVGDIITYVNNEKISDLNSIIGIFRDTRIGEVVTLTIYRDKKTLKIPLTIEKPKS
ncbi:MAG: trypsin-like peptidase domain-containing protein [Bacteroidetes bacterium]|nr:trypsin-like peptidase domain-containing protein [Bacteroidota bacterium]